MIESEKYRIHFEPGVHSFFESQHRDISKRYYAGDSSARHWNPQVAQRMRGYSPYIVGMDSYASSIDQDEGFFDWPWLPGTPLEMSGRDSIYTVSGDLLHWQLAPPNSGNEPFTQYLREIGSDKLKSYVIKSTLEGLATLSLTVLAAAALLRSKERFSRRNLFRIGLGAATASLFGVNVGRMAPVAQSFSTNSSLESLFQIITDITKPRFNESRWLDGRTALVIAKTIESMNVLDLPQGSNGSVVMGYPHAYEARKLLEDKGARMQTIRGYAEDLIADVFPIVKKVGWAEDNEEDRQYVTDVTLTFLSLTDIILVKESSFEEWTTYGDPHAPSTERIKRFKSVEVKEAVKDLGDPEKHFEV